MSLLQQNGICQLVVGKGLPDKGLVPHMSDGWELG